MNGQMRYHCADGRRIPEGHNTDDCPPCLRAQRDGIRREYETNVNVDLVKRLQEMDQRIRMQRHELAELNRKVIGQRTPVTAWTAFEAWVIPTLQRHDYRFASVAFRAGWQAARRAIALPDDCAPESRSDAKP